jgi:hypothetical protein
MARISAQAEAPYGLHAHVVVFLSKFVYFLQCMLAINFSWAKSD